MGKGILYNKRYWHQACLLSMMSACKICKQKFEKGAKAVKLLSGGVVHPSCMKCDVCGIGITDQFHQKGENDQFEGEIMCPDCWGEHKIALAAKPCVMCKLPIHSGMPTIQVQDKAFHQECFKCFICRSRIRGPYAVGDMGVVCKACDLKAKAEEEEKRLKAKKKRKRGRGRPRQKRKSRIS